MAGMTLREMQEDVDRYISQYQEGYFHPMTLVVRLAEELGELAREVNHRFGQKPKKPGEADGSVALELGDILFVVTCLANSLQIDLEEVHRAVMEKFRTRDKDRWTPVDRGTAESEGMAQ
ncbi:nucleotide pyrophosphohydrolase [Kyrpidia spormannii]|uniref:Nucleotide pyrophosphohydrolase n=3 Tax=Alicyclobacillaceae TaxID=186823 RepID=A0A2K8N697_9BACL|nr:nucleotide pyrophosphohydrolase [Kyrpidia spormannii]CAB3392124.1 oxidized nucleotide pyrophosphohydrolase [Kyrpidia spormannii]CAB3393044.1 oxidized nucleotide pyrophosphohydrolase [Kyrpidia spormannii]